MTWRRETHPDCQGGGSCNERARGEERGQNESARPIVQQARERRPNNLPNSECRRQHGECAARVTSGEPAPAGEAQSGDAHESPA